MILTSRSTWGPSPNRRRARRRENPGGLLGAARRDLLPERADDLLRAGGYDPEQRGPEDQCGFFHGISPSGSHYEADRSRVPGWRHRFCASPGVDRRRWTRRPAFQELASGDRPIRDLGLRIAGTLLEPVIAEFERELRRPASAGCAPASISRRSGGCRSGRWRSPSRSISPGRTSTAIHAERTGHVEGLAAATCCAICATRWGTWSTTPTGSTTGRTGCASFGPITRPYLEEYRPEPFSRRYVRHLPGWYAQKHPDEDWAETFAVWMTPGLDWRAEYAGWPEALAKLEYCDRVMRRAARARPAGDRRRAGRGRLRDRLHAGAVLQRRGSRDRRAPAGARRRAALDLRGLGAPRGPVDGRAPPARLGADPPPRRATCRRTSTAGPATSRSGRAACCSHLAERADALEQVYPEDRETPAIIALTTLVTALAMNHVQRGSYMP